MDNISQRLKAYIEAHPFDSGDSSYETVLDQLYQAYQESHESDPPGIRTGLKDLAGTCLCGITMPSLTSAAVAVPPMSIKHFSTVSNTVQI